MEGIYIYRSNGFYIGFINNGNFFSPNGIYQGWIEGKFVWDSGGHFKGVITEINGKNYILVKRFAISPVNRTPKPVPTPVVPLAPQTNIAAISLPLDIVDSF